MGRMQRTKGRSAEQAIVNLAKAAGLPAERTWYLARSRKANERRCDVKIAGRPHQVKIRAKGFTMLYEALIDVDAAFIRQDEGAWLVVMSADRYLATLNSDQMYDLNSDDSPQ